jgi:lipopolysaccharide export system protein LptA
MAIYDLNRRLVTMLGNVVLTRGGNVVHGSRAVLDLNTNHATVDGSSVAGGGNGGGRVSGHFTVPQKDNGATATKPQP